MLTTSRGARVTLQGELQGKWSSRSLDLQTRQFFGATRPAQKDLSVSAYEALLGAIRYCAPNKVPKGFGKFYGSNGSKARSGARSRAAREAEEKAGGSQKNGGSSSSESSSSGSSSSGSGSGSGSGQHKGTGIPGTEPPKLGPQQVITASVAMFLIFNFLSNNDNTLGREINWQEFKTMLLASGSVERIVVVNKQYAKVYLNTTSYEGASQVAGGGFPGVGVEPMQPGESKNDQTFMSEDKYASTSIDKYAADAPANMDTNRQGENGYARRLNPAGNSLYYFTIGSIDSFERKLEQAQREMGIASRHYIPVQYVNHTNWLTEMMKLAPTVLIIGAWLFMMRNVAGGGGGGGMSNIFKIGKSNAKMIGKTEKVGVSFKDVAGCDEAKVEIMEFVEFLKNPKRFTDVGAKIPKGALLCGPPGTGKTLLAKATAGEASVPFFSISGSDFIEMFVGVGPSRVRDLFANARKESPCIIFIDEIDAVARARGKGGFSGGNDERENTLNQLLVEMDGFSTKEGVVVLAGTNRIDILDQAILRPGRFDRQIKVDLPDIKGRKEIFDVHLRELHVDGDKNDVAQRMAALSPGFSGAQIANICNEAAILAARKGLEKINMECFDGAIDRVIGGLEKKNSLMSPDERKTVAYHEAGHAVAGWFLEHADPLLKVTIVPRMSGALGFAQYLPKELALHTKDQLLDRMAMALGGRVAEELNFGTITSGARDDLDKVTKMAYSMVTQLGMNDRIGNLSFSTDDSQLVQTKMYSERTAEIIDEEVMKIVNSTYERCKKLLTENSDAVKAVAEKLLEQETITQHDISDAIGPRPFAMPQSYQDFIEAKVSSLETSEDETGAETEAGDDEDSSEGEASSDNSEVDSKGDDKSKKDPESEKKEQ